MAYDITEIKGEAVSTKIRQFAVDFITDIDRLPTQTKKGESTDNQPFEEGLVATGSTALCGEDGNVYYLYPSGWKIL